MTKNELFEILGDIDNADVKPSKSFKWVKWASIAACFALISVVSIPIINSNPPISNPEPNNLYAYTEQSDDKPKPIHSQNETRIAADMPADVSGTPVVEAVYTTDLSSEAAAVFGGSYLDESGNFVVVLTDDTPENRKLICRELGRKETTVTFKTGTYTLLYLTELQDKISNEMTNKNLPAVSSSAVIETSNRIEVCVAPGGDETVKKLQALDTIGGAIEVVEVCGYPTADVLKSE